MNELVRRLLFLPEQASSVATEIDGLHYFVIGVTMLGSGAVFLAAFWFALRYRRRSEDELTPTVTSPVWMEASVIGALLTLFVVIWVIGFRQFVRLQVPPEDAMVVYVTAKQWMWKFAHPAGKAELSTLVVPAGRPVRLVMTSRDVIHSFFVPSFRIKQDVLPGRYTEVWFEATRTGDFPVYCTEYCGTGHSKMWAEVLVLDAATYQRWLEGETPEELIAVLARPVEEQVPAPRGVAVPVGERRSLAQRGREIAAGRGCLSCHTLDGSRHIGPSWRGLYGTQRPLADGTVEVANDAYLTRSMMDPAAQLVAGFPPVMPTYRGLLEPAETAALLELIRSLRGEAP